MLKRVMFAAGMLAACVTGLASRPAQAAETGLLSHTPGAPGPFVGMFPPVPGLFLLSQSFFSPASPPYGADGKRSPLPIEVGVGGSAQRFLLAYPGTFLGAKLYQQLILPLVNIEVTAFGAKNSEFGLGNVTISPFILSWPIAQRQNVVFGLDIVTPWGSYEAARGVNIAHNYGSIQPVLAYRYYDPQGFTAGAAARLLINGTNDAKQYRSGNAYAIDFDVGYSVGKFRFGVVGGYADQFEDDQRFGRSVPGGNRYRKLTAGPSISYDFGGPMLNVNYQFGVLANNTIKSDTLWVNLAIPLYLHGGAPGAPVTRPLVAKN